MIAEQIIHQGFCPPRLLANFFRQAPRPAVHGRIVREQLGIAQNGRQRIIDFVSGTADQLTERREFFRLHVLRLQALQIVERLLGSAQQFEALRIH